MTKPFCNTHTHTHTNEWIQACKKKQYVLSTNETFLQDLLKNLKQVLQNCSEADTPEFLENLEEMFPLLSGGN